MRDGISASITGPALHCKLISSPSASAQYVAAQVTEMACLQQYRRACAKFELGTKG
jgi:hypothetical protein